MALRRKTRESRRHERAVVLQQLGAQAAADPRPDWRRNRQVAKRLADKARGGEPDASNLGLVVGKPLAGGKGTPDSPGYVHTTQGWAWA